MAVKKYKKPRQSKQLLENIKSDNRIHYDRVNDLFADEHYGYYLIVKDTSSKKSMSNRLYLSRDKLQKFYEIEYPKQHGSINIGTLKVSKLNLFDIYPEEKNYIAQLVFEIIDENLSRKTVEALIKGLSFFIDTMKKNNIVLPSIKEFNQNHQKIVHDAVKKKDVVNAYRYFVSSFFALVSRKNPNFIHQNIPSLNGQTIGLPGLPLDVIFQLDYYSREELEQIIKHVSQYKEWISEFENKEFFSLQNLAYTYYKHRSHFVKEAIALNKISIALHGVDLKCWKASRGAKFYYTDESERERHYRLIKLSEGGVDISLRSLKMFALWHKNICPNWPYGRDMSSPFDQIWTGGMDSWRSNQAYKLNISLTDFDSRIYPSINQLYPLILLILLRHGINQEVAKNWQVREENGHYILGDTIDGLALLIEGIKERSNAIVDVAIPFNSEEHKYINFYLDWLKPLYRQSKSKNFFQYITVNHQGNNIVSWHRSTLYSMQIGKNKFYKKYEIVDENNMRIYRIDHRSIRVSVNYMDYLQGLTEFERQISKGHASIETQRHYENNTEWIGDKRRKILNTQERIVGIFVGKILEAHDPKAAIFNGPLADCSDPLKPTYKDANLKTGEICCNWTKCLTGCEKCIVIPKIHGPVISAWISVLEDERAKYERVQDWNKEYLIDYEAASNVFIGFTNEQQTYSQENNHKYISFVKSYLLGNKFSRKTNIKKVQNG